MKKLILLAMVFTFSTAAWAQADCRAYLTVVLKDLDGKPVPGVEVAVEVQKPAAENIPVHIFPERAAGGSYSFAVDYPCNRDFFSNRFIIRPSSPDFMDTGLGVTLAPEAPGKIGGTNIFEVEMRGKKDFRSLVHGRFLTLHNGSFPDTDVVFTAKDGKKLTARTDRRGEYKILLPPGPYRITAKSKLLIKKFKLDNYLVPWMGDVTLDLCAESFPNVRI